MSKILIFSDVHWNTTSSIVLNRGDFYSARLHRLINSMNWVNEIAVKEGCSMMICAGDFFDKAVLTDEQATALRSIQWRLPCSFLCGNHESSVSDLRFNMLNIFIDSAKTVIDTPTIQDFGNCEICYLPYVTESDKKPLSEYFPEKNKKRIIISHNDIAGISYYGYESQVGFSIDEIENNCDLYLNGHLHNTMWITKKILNVGSFSAHNFTNDSTKYSYGAWILDTDKSSIQFIENPCGYNFYKLEINANEDLKQLEQVKKHAVISVKCVESLLDAVNETIKNNTDIIDMYRISTIKVIGSTDETAVQELQGTDHIERLKQFCHENIENTSVLEEELAIICK